MKKWSFKSLLALAGTAFCLYLAVHFLPNITEFVKTLIKAIAPIFIGFCIAYVVNPVMSSLEKMYFPKSKKKFFKKTRRPLCMFLSYVALITAVGLLVWLVLPQLIECIKLVIALAPSVIQKTLDILEKYQLLSDKLLTTLESVDWENRIEQILAMVTTGVSGVVDLVIQTVTGVIRGIVTAFLSLIFSVYLLADKERLKRQGRRLAQAFMPAIWYTRFSYVLQVVNESFRRYIVGQCVEAVILGLLCAVGMLILRLPYATMIGTLVGFTALIPIAGAYIGAAVGAFMILTVSPVKALIFLIFLLVLQQLEGNLIYPRVVGSSIGLPAIWVLAAITVGGGLAGIAGMFIAVPIAAAVYRILREATAKKEALQNPETQSH